MINRVVLKFENETKYNICKTWVKAKIKGQIRIILITSNKMKRVVLKKKNICVEKGEGNRKRKTKGLQGWLTMVLACQVIYGAGDEKKWEDG